MVTLENLPSTPPAAVRIVYFVEGRYTPSAANTLTADPLAIETEPRALIRSASPCALASTAKVDPEAKERSPATVIVPIEFPGAKVPPFATVTVPVVPVPPKVAPESTNTSDLIEPLTTSVPPLTSVSPVYVLSPESVSVPSPHFSREASPPIEPSTQFPPSIEICSKLSRRPTDWLVSLVPPKVATSKPSPPSTAPSTIDPVPRVR